MITVTFACGHQQSDLTGEKRPVCHCGETRIERVDAPAPVFRGVARGPCAEYKPLEAIPVSFESKEQSNG